MSKIFAKVNDGWFAYWVCKRCGKKIQLYVDNKPLPPSCPECGYGLDIKEEKKTMNKYVCPICGKSYDTVSEMAKCALACDELKSKQDKAEEERQRQAAIDEISELYNKLQAKVSEFNQNYPEMSVSTSMKIGQKKKIGANESFPNEWKVPLNYSINKNNSPFSSLIDAFLGEDK